MHLNERNSTNNCFLQNKLEENIYTLLRKETNNESNRENKSNKNLNNVNIAKSIAISSSYSIV